MDFFAQGMQAVATRSALAPVLVFSAGVLSSFGPCVAPRFIAVVSCAGSSTSRMPAVVGAFLGGLVAAYAAFGFAASLVGRLVDIASWTYGAVALALLVGGILTLVRASPHDHCHADHEVPPRALSFGGVFLLGASFAFVIAPCCTPLLATIIAYTSDVGDPVYGASMLAIFALGHGLPVGLLGLGAG
ncbi:MAG TPA: cytochrome c biogenesis protein CcdA, partial [Candidatus Acidoferrales bacterium]|nr:cytochrome c biogenesis protein CcdA [Candidatus Acidoferrales bacterium]